SWKLDSDTGYGTRIRLAAHHGRRRRADPGVSGAQLERVLSSLPERTAARVHRIYAGALPAGGGIRSDHAARLALHRWRRVPGLWRRRTEVPTVGLGGVLRDRLRGLGRHVAHSAADIKP